MKSLLGQLYNGSIQPAEKCYPQDEAHKKLIDACLQKHRDFRESLSPELLEAYEDMEDANLALAYENNKIDFVDGFCLGARMMMEILAE